MEIDPANIDILMEILQEIRTALRLIFGAIGSIIVIELIKLKNKEN